MVCHGILGVARVADVMEVTAIRGTQDGLVEKTLIRRGRRFAALGLGLAAAVLLSGALGTMRYVGRTWSEEDIEQCQASAFVGEAVADGAGAVRAATQECVEHRRAKRWGPWGAFGSADDGSKYNAADD
jgi:hypothetical protein